MYVHGHLLTQSPRITSTSTYHLHVSSPLIISLRYTPPTPGLGFVRCVFHDKGVLPLVEPLQECPVDVL